MQKLFENQIKKKYKIIFFAKLKSFSAMIKSFSA
jgi:hypothetical protein